MEQQVGHDDFVSSSYFAVADINASMNIENELTAYDADNNFGLIDNVNMIEKKASGSFF